MALAVCMLCQRAVYMRFKDTHVEYAGSLSQLVTLVPASYDILDSWVEGRLCQACGNVRQLGSAEHDMLDVNVPTKKRTATSVEKLFDDARIMVKELHISSMAGI